MRKHSLKNKKYLMISSSIIILLWQVIAIIIDNRVLLPSFFNVLESIIDIVVDNIFINIIYGSISRAILSFFISVCVAIILGIISYYSNFIYNLLYPIILVVKSVPTMALIVLLLIWTSKNYAPIIIGIIIAFPIFYEVVINGLINIDERLNKLCNVYNVKRRDKILGIVLPSVILEIGKVFSSTLSLIFKVVISGEIYSQPLYGIGSIIQIEKMNLNTNYVMAWMFIIVIIVYVFDQIVERIQNKIIIGGGHYENIKYKY